MFDLNQLTGALSRYAGGSGQHPPESVHADFDEVSQKVPPGTLAEGISHAFRSDQTPPFSQMISQLFRSGNSQQKAGLLNVLLSAVGPSGLSGAGGALSGLMGMLGSGQSQFGASQATQVPPEAVEALAHHAEQQNPSAIDQVSQFVTQHPSWVKTLGSGALSLALSRMAGQHA